MPYAELDRDRTAPSCSPRELAGRRPLVGAGAAALQEPAAAVLELFSAIRDRAGPVRRRT